MQKKSCSECTADEPCVKCAANEELPIIGNDESEDDSVDSDDDSNESDEESEEAKEEDAKEEDDVKDEDEDLDNVKEEDLDKDIESLIYDPSITVDTENGINRRIIVQPEKRITSNMLTQLEMARAIAIRAANIDAKGHDNAFIDIKGCDSAGEIAKKELYSRRSPLVLFRHVGMNHWEKFAIREMSFK